MVTAYFKSNTSKGKDTILLYATIIFCWRYCRRCERRWPHDYNDDDENDENRSNDDDINDFDEENDSKSEVNHKKKVNDEPQKETRKRKALDTAEEESPKKKVCFYIHVRPDKKLNENSPIYLTSWPSWKNREKVSNNTKVLYKWRFCGCSRPASLTSLIESCHWLIFVVLFSVKACL